MSSEQEQVKIEKTESNGGRGGAIPVPSEDLFKASEDTPRKRISVPTLLRRVGGLVLVGSALTFLLQRWVGMDSVLRYYSFLGFTLTLSAMGVFCGLGIKEEKGARTFLSIAAMFLPAHFTQVGALLYSLRIDNHAVQFAGQYDYVRTLAIYQAPNGYVAFGTLVLSVVCMIPVVYFGFTSMARAESKRLTLTYFLGSALLLIPSREPYLVAALVAVAVTVLTYVDVRFFSEDSAMKTFEGAAVRAMMFIPVALLLGRSILLYPSTAVLQGALWLLAAFVLFEVLPKFLVSDSGKRFLQVVSTVPLLCSWAHIAQDLFFRYQAPFRIDRSYELVTYVVPVSIAVGLLSFRAHGSGAGLRKLASFAAIASLVLHLLFSGGMLISLVCLIVSTLVLLVAVQQEEKATFRFGLIGLAASLLYHARSALDVFNVSPWLSLAVLGTSFVLFASYLEANPGVVQERVAALRTRYRNWR